MGEEILRFAQDDGVGEEILRCAQDDTSIINSFGGSMEKFLNELLGAELAAQVMEKHNAVVSGLRLEFALDRAVEKCGGRNKKAIRAMLDESAILQAEDVDTAATAAVESLKKENGWLFLQPQVSSPGTGAMTVTRSPSLEDVGNMSMAEYRRYRQGR